MDVSFDDIGGILFLCNMTNVLMFHTTVYIGGNNNNNNNNTIPIYSTYVCPPLYGVFRNSLSLINYQIKSKILLIVTFVFWGVNGK